MDDQERRAREENRAIPSLSQPAVIPEGWLYDYDYNSELGEYLRRKRQSASSSSRSTYVYLYADWDEACKAFRRTADRKDYKELFQDSDIIMVEYVFLKIMYGARINKLPVFLKVHDNGVMGPETIYPVSSKNEHPRKAFHKLKKFFQSNADAS